MFLFPINVDANEKKEVKFSSCIDGDTVLVIEHNLDVIKCADQIIDMGPEGGQGGGTVICTGTPEKVAACKESYTGQYLKPMLEKGGDHGKSNCS